MKRPIVMVLLPSTRRVDHLYDQIVRQAIANTGAHALLADEIAGSSENIDRVLSEIASADLVVADLSVPEPNLIYGIGYRRGLRKALIGITELGVDVPTSIRFLPHTFYSRHSSSDDENVALLTRKIRFALDHLAEIASDWGSSNASQRSKVFVSYSHRDREHLDRLLVHLEPLQREDRLDFWADTHLQAGDDWKASLEAALERATAAILLVSADYLASNFIRNNELPPLLRKAEKVGTRILPVILKPCRFTREPELSRFQAVNDPARPLIQLSVAEQEATYDRVSSIVESLSPGA